VEKRRHLFPGDRIVGAKLGRATAFGDFPGLEPFDVSRKGIVRSNVEKTGGRLAGQRNRDQDDGDG
jgi:hypothetical protein